MAKTYPLISMQNVQIKSGNGTTKTNLKQKVTMFVSPTKDGTQTLFDLTTKHEEEISSVMSIFSKTEGSEKKYFVKLGQLQSFIDGNGHSLEADESLSALFSENGLEIGANSNAISMTKSKDQIVISVNAKDKKPYTIIATPTSISLEYGDGDDKVKYDYSTKDESCIDINVNRRVVKDILSSKEGESIFKPVKGVRTLPANIIGQYFSGMENNSQIELNGVVLTRCSFGEDTPPCCFIKQKNSKGKEERLFYVDGKIVPCSGDILFLYEKGPDGRNHYTMHIESSTNPKVYYQIPVPISNDENTSPQFAKGYALLMNYSGLDFYTEYPPYSPDLKTITIPANDGSQIYVEAKIHDGRTSSNVSFTINDRKLTMFESFSPEPLNFRNPYDEVASEGEYVASPTEPIVDDGSDDDSSSDSDEGSGESAGDSVETSEHDDTESSGDVPDSRGNDDGHSSGDEESETETEDENDGDNTSDSGNSSNSGNSGNTTDQSDSNKNSDKAKENEDDEEAEKARIDKKNKAFKDNLKTMNNIMGETLTTIGAWLLLCSLIPGVGLLTLIPGAIIAGLGLIQTTFADNLVFSPFRKAKKKINQYEIEQEEEFNAREKFIENERELDTLEQDSTQKTDILAKMYDQDLSENTFAKEFASIYNSNGIGIASPTVGGTRASDLNSLDNLDTRISMALSLDQISKTEDPETKQALIDTFTASYFSNLSADQVTTVTDLFRPENSEHLSKYIIALNEANSAQIKQRTLYEAQRESVRSADFYRLKYFASTEAMTAEERIVFFDRYKTDIIQNAVLSHEGTTEVINQIIENVPEESRDQVISILNDGASQVGTDLQIIDKEAKENIDQHKQVENLQAYKSAIDDVTEQKDNVTTIDSCIDATDKYIKTYSLAYYNGYADKLEQNVTQDALETVSGTGLSEEAKIFSSVSDALSTIKPTEPSKEIKAVDEAFNAGGYLSKVTTGYAAVSVGGESLLGDGGLLADPSKQKVEKSHTTYAIADTFAKSDIVEFIVEQAKSVGGIDTESLKAELETKSLPTIIKSYAVAAHEDGKISFSLNGTIVENDGGSAYSSAVYGASRAAYETTKKQQIDTSLSNVSKQVTRQTRTKPLVKYDEAKKVYVVANYNINVKKDDKDAFIEYSEDEIIDEYTKKYPYFASLSKEEQRDVIMLKLGVQGQKSRLQAERDRKFARKEEFDEDLYQTKLQVYDRADRFADTILDGSIFVAYDERAFESVLDPEHKLGRDLTSVKSSGQELLSTLEKYHNLQKIIGELPLSREDRSIIEANLSHAHMLNPDMDFDSAFIEQIKPFMQKQFVDGENIYDIMARYTDIETPSANDQERAEKASGFDSFCADKNQTIDRRTSTNLTAIRARNGQAFVDREYKIRKSMISDGTIEYSTTVELLGQILFNEQAGTSIIPDKLKADSRELLEEKIAIKLADAKTSKERDALIMSWLPESYRKEYESAKKYVLDTLPTEENLEYYRKNRDYRLFNLNASNFITGIDAILSNPDLSPEDEEEREKLIKDIEKTELYLERAGVYGLDLIKVIETRGLTDAEKREQINTLLEKYAGQLEIQEARLKDEKEHADAARQGNSDRERKANGTKDSLERFEKAKQEFDAKFKAIEEYIIKHPDYQYSKELVNAFVEGDYAFFQAHPEFAPEGLEFGNMDKYLFEKLGIIDSIGKLKQKPTEQSNVAGLTSTEARAKSDKTIQENKALLKDIKVKKASLDSKIEAKVEGLKIQAENDYDASVHRSFVQGTDIGEIDRSEAITALSGISKFLSKVKEQRDEARAEEAAREAEISAREAAARATASRETEEAETEESETEETEPEETKADDAGKDDPEHSES